jgi:hypothetical protein
MINQQKMNNDNNNIELNIFLNMHLLVDHVGKQCHFCLSCERFHDSEALDCNVLDYDIVA